MQVHAVFMSFMVALSLAAIIWIKVFRTRSKLHITLASSGVVLGIIGVTIMFLKKSSGSASHFNTAHGMTGIGGITLLLAAGVLGVLFKKLKLGSVRKAHKILASIAFAVILGALFGGLKYLVG